MSTENQQVASQNPGGYGYASDEVKVSPFNFGLNAGNARLTKFEWINNAGKDGAEGEALDIVFTINEGDKSYRMFPVTKAFLKDNGGETTDPNAPEFKEAMVDFNARVTHILHAFLESDTIKAGMSRPISSFKEYCEICMSLLPKNFKDIPLDIFLQYQWQLGANAKRTYLDIPKSMKYGAWLKPAVPGTWTRQMVENPTDDTRKALWYTNEKNEEHPFFRNGWFMQSNFAHQQNEAGAEESQQAATNTANDGAKKAAAW